MDKFYIQLDKDNVVRDCITYPYKDYMDVDLEVPLPRGILSGYYKYENGVLVLDEALKAEVEKENRPYGYDELENKLYLMQKAIDDIILLGGVM